MSIVLVIPSNHLILLFPSYPQSPGIKVNESALFQWVNFFTSCGQSIGVSASVLPMNIQDWSPLGLTGLISLLSKGLSRVFSSTTIQKDKLLNTRTPLWSKSTSVHDYWKNHSFDQMDLCWQSDISAFNILSRFDVAFLPRSKYLLI